MFYRVPFCLLQASVKSADRWVTQQMTTILTGYLIHVGELFSRPAVLTVSCITLAPLGLGRVRGALA